MTNETAPTLPSEMVVACGTCDSVYRVHAGRQTCPCCGGDPGVLLFEIPTVATPATEGIAAPSPVAEPPPTAGPAPPPQEPQPEAAIVSGATGDTQGAGAGEAAEEKGRPASRRRSKP